MNSRRRISESPYKISCTSRHLAPANLLFFFNCSRCPTSKIVHIGHKTVISLCEQTCVLVFQALLPFLKKNKPATFSIRHKRLLGDDVICECACELSSALSALYVGINASDVNHSSGRYDPSMKLPFDNGFEGIGEVVALGLSASANYSVGQAVSYLGSASFAEYTVVPAKNAVPVPSMKPHFLPLLISATTAYISLKKFGDLSEHKKVLVTAAAGGTGQFAVQLAKKAKCHVIGTCSSDEKAAFLKSIGCDRTINYKAENLGQVLKREYPEGIDVVYESIGGDMFDLAVRNLATNGCLIIIGFLSGYQTTSGLPSIKGDALPALLLKKSASIRGFFLFNHFSEFKAAMMALLNMYASGELLCEVDLGDQSPEGRFLGLESVFRAVDYMYTGKNIGKIVVELPPPVNSKL